MDFQWLRSFVTVVEARSFTHAAQQLNMTQPAVSRHIQKLERDLGTALIDRSSSSIHLTPAGEQFYAYASEALQRYHDVINEVRQSSQPIGGVLRIVASTTPGEYLVPDLVSRFTATYPNVQPHIIIGDSTVVVDELSSQRRDVGFVGAKLHSKGIRYHSIAEDEVVLAVPRDHPFSGRQVISLDELTGQPFLEREGGSGTVLSVQRELTRRGLKLPEHRTVMVLSSTDAVLSAVERGYGLGWVSSLALQQRQSTRAVAVRLTGVPLDRSLYLAYYPDLLSRISRAFVDWTLQQAAFSDANATE